MSPAPSSGGHLSPSPRPEHGAPPPRAAAPAPSKASPSSRACLTTDEDDKVGTSAIHGRSGPHVADPTAVRDLGVDGISFTVHPLSGFRLPSTSGRGSPEARSAAAPEESIYLLPFLHASSPRGAARFPLATGATKKQQDKVCGRSFWNLAHQMQPERQMREIESESCSAAGSVQGYAGEPSAS